MEDKRKEIDKKFAEFFNQEWDKIDVDEELLSCVLKANEMYSKAIKKYLRTVAVIEFNILKTIKDNSVNFKTMADMNNFVVNAIKSLKKKKDLSKTEQIELKTLLKFKENVIIGKGKEFDVTKGFKFAYDHDVDVDFEPVTMKN